MRLIDADAVRDDFANTVDLECANDKDNSRANRIIDAFDDLPTIEVEPVRHGEWTEKKSAKGIFDYYFVCSECHKNTPDRAFLIAPDYCPNCGAKMDMGES